MEKLRAEAITRSYEGEKVIEEIFLHLEEGERVALLGVSGIGKTTLFNCLAGIETPDAGKIYLDGKEITGQTGRLSYMQQKDLLLPYYRIIDNAALPLWLKGIPRGEARLTAFSFFRAFGLEGCEHKYPHQLSGGMRQRAALLRTYLFSQEVLLLDEPFSALDALTKREMHRWFLETLQKLNLSALLITHDIDEAIYLADRIYIMAGHPGRITAEIAVRESKKDESFLLSPRFSSYKKQVLGKLHMM